MASTDSKKYRYIRVSSNDAINETDTNSNFHVDMSNDLNLQQIKEVWFQGMSVPYTWTNIYSYTTPNSSTVIQNNLFVIQFSTSGTPTTYVIPPGYYNIITLMALIQNDINSDPDFAGNTISITQNPITQQVNFAITGTTMITYFNSSNGSSLAPYIGILNTTIPQTNYTTDTIPHLQGDEYIFINSKEILPNNTRLSNGQSVSAFASVPLARFPFLSIIKYESWGSLIDRDVLNTVNLANIGFTLRGDGGRILNIAPNDETVIIFKVYYE